MEKFTKLKGVAAPLRMINVDTDMIIPENRTPRPSSARALPRACSPKSAITMTATSILISCSTSRPIARRRFPVVAGDNFGCGSSRAAAPGALLDFGIRAVISTRRRATSSITTASRTAFCRSKSRPKNSRSCSTTPSAGANATLTIDLEKQEIRAPDGGVICFEIDPHRKHCLLHGLDDIGLTLRRWRNISAYEEKA